jgi:hypothetical protein
MLCDISYMPGCAKMPMGQSGRLVIEIDPHLKRRLHSALAADGTTLKSWFIEIATEWLNDREQPRFPVPGTKPKKR